MGGMSKCVYERERIVENAQKLLRKSALPNTPLCYNKDMMQAG